MWFLTLRIPFFAEIARFLEQRCIDAGYRPTLYSAHGQPDLELEILDSLRSLKPAGLLIAPLGRASDHAAIEKFSADIPTVLFDSNLQDLGLAFVGSDNPQFSMLMVDYLCRTGEPPCFLEMKNPANPNANRRRNGYVRAMELLGHKPSIVQIQGEGWAFEDIGRREGGAALVANKFTSRTILCSNDRLAIGFLTACFEQRVRVGRDRDCEIRIAGQDDHPFARFTCPPLTTIAQDYEAISRHAAETLFQAIEGAQKSYETTLNLVTSLFCEVIGQTLHPDHVAVVHCRDCQSCGVAICISASCSKQGHRCRCTQCVFQVHPSPPSRL